jgi:general secretion pathway protein M
LVSAVEERKAAWIEKKTTLLWMQQAQRAYAHEQQPTRVTAATLLSVLTELLTHVSFQRFPYQLEQTSSGDIQLTFDAVPYNLFVSWLQTQSKQYTLVIKSLYLSKTDTPGVVKAAVVFTVEA